MPVILVIGEVEIGESRSEVGPWQKFRMLSEK
jgi:hypothetical protein